MLDETTPAETPDHTGSEGAADLAADSPAQETVGEAKPAKKAAAKKAPAKKAAAKKAPAKKAAAKRAAAAEVPAAAEEALAVATSEPGAAEPTKKAPARRTRKAPAKKTADALVASESPVEAAPQGDAATEVDPASAVDTAPEAEVAPAKKAAAKRATAKKTAAKKAPAKKAAAKKTAAKTTAPEVTAETVDALAEATTAPEAPLDTSHDSGTLPLFQAPEAVKKAPARRTRKRAAAPAEEASVEKTAIELAEEAAQAAEAEAAAEVADEIAPVETTEERETPAPEAAEDADDSDSDSDGDDGDDTEDSEGGAPTRRRRRRGGRRRRRSGDSNGQGGDDSQEGDSEAADGSSDSEDSDESSESEESSDNGDGESSSSSSRRRRRRRRSNDNDSETPDDPDNTVVRVRKPRSAEDQITSLAGSTRLEAKKQRRREGREAGRRRAPIVSEAEFLARRESVERVMVVRQRKDLTQIAVLEDKVLVEHYVARESQTSLIGNVYLGRVQNVLPSMEAAFIDIGKGRNAVLYAGEVNWSALGHKDGQPRKIESVLSPGQPVLVQVSKDPIGHKGARLTSQISLAGRFLVYVPDGTTSGISRKLPDTERSRLKALLKEIVPDSAGVIVRTAAEGASEEELTQDVERLKARWEDIEAKGRGNAPQLLYGEPDLTLKVVRDLFTEDFTKLVIEGDDAWETVSNYVQHVAPDLAERLERYAPADNASAQQGDSFAVHRIDEQIAKGLDRKVWLPSGGSLVIDRTEAMTVVDVNTGKFTGSGGNLEETVTKNNLEAAEEIVRQLRLRDIGGIIVVDFIDMVLESNRDLVVRRMVECLGRDRTRHQVAEVTSLGLVQMTRKRIGTGLLEAFSSDCEHCQGRGVVTHAHPVEAKQSSDDDGRRGGRRGRGRGGDSKNDNSGGNDQSSQKSAGNEQSSQKSEQRNENDNQRSGRRRGRGGEGNTAQKPEMTEPAESTETAQVVETPAAPEAPEAPAPAAAEPAAETPAAEAPAAEAPAADVPVDTKPRVVTRSRRRGASRPVTEAVSEVAPIVVESTPAVPAAEPVVAPVAEAIRPKVVTRTRGRAASRPSGSPAGETTGADSSESPDAGSEPTVEHVPVKKKGTRKR